MKLPAWLRRPIEVHQVTVVAAPGSALPAPCASCKWWVRNDAITAKVMGGTVTPRGECRIREPKIFLQDRGPGAGNLVTRWPTPCATDFCREHEAAAVEGGRQNAEGRRGAV